MNINVVKIMMKWVLVSIVINTIQTPCAYAAAGQVERQHALHAALRWLAEDTSRGFTFADGMAGIAYMRDGSYRQNKSYADALEGCYDTLVSHVEDETQNPVTDSRGWTFAMGAIFFAETIHQKLWKCGNKCHRVTGLCESY